MLFDYIKASKFFPKYCPLIKNWKHKLRGLDGNKKKIEFSATENKQIKQALKVLFKDLGSLSKYQLNGKILAKGGICSTTVDGSTNDG